MVYFVQSEIWKSSGNTWDYVKISAWKSGKNQVSFLECSALKRKSLRLWKFCELLFSVVVMKVLALFHEKIRHDKILPFFCIGTFRLRTRIVISPPLMVREGRFDFT